jgi:SAM-dependent methyltransferase
VALRVRSAHRSAFADRHLAHLTGLEIGGSAHNDFGLATRNVDVTADLGTVYKREERERCGRVMPVDVVAPGDELPFGDDAVGFVLASHVIEHFPDPIRALEEWLRVAREKVVLFVPHRDRTFDRDRPVTPVDELLARHAAGLRSAEDRHWTVWTCESFLELCARRGYAVLDHLDPDDKTHNGFAVALSP